MPRSCSTSCLVNGSLFFLFLGFWTVLIGWEIGLPACISSCTYWNGGSGSFCGTSGAAPTFAGIVADIMQAKGSRLGFLNPTLYSITSTDPSVYHDVTTGCSLVEVGSNTQTRYCAHAGWDFVTGWGSIDASQLAKHLAPKAIIASEFPSGPAGFLLTTAITVTICTVCLRSTKARREMG